MSDIKLHIIAALRMLLSQEKLVTIRAVPQKSGEMPDTAKAIVEQGYYNKQEAILEIPFNGRGNLEGLREAISQWMSSKGELPAFVAIKEMGAFVVAGCAACANSLAAKAKWYTYNSPPKRMENKVVIVTGGAQGFGAGIAEAFFQEGANVVIADVNETMGSGFVEALNAKDLPNKAYFVHTNVSDFSSVENLVTQTVLHFGGVDVMISNAGILRAGGLDEMTPETFELMTKVNYSGYFHCAKAAASIMKLQSKYSAHAYFDILQINSKSGLKGSNKNFAYAGGKFGGVGLTQSFALELMPYRIKVNAICPGNFFDGPLWSDPEKGLFVQYLKAGKVPGAQTIEDVKVFYESQVPAGRGCGTMDVAKAAFYAIEQEYETGQAIPVTGGQNMLH